MRVVFAGCLGLIAACGTPVAVEPPAAPVPSEPAESAELIACRDAHCADSGENTECMAASCAQTPGQILAGVKTIRFEDNTLFVELTPQVTPARVGDVAIERTSPIYVGVTAVTTEGQEVDLLVQELVPGTAQGSVVFTAELDETVAHVLVGLWDTKIAPCDVDRSGCKEFGFVLDGSLATYPPGVYETGHRQRLLHEPLGLRISAARSLDARRVRALRQAIEQAAEPVVAVYGVALNAEVSPAVDRAGIEVRHRHPQDIYLAERIAERLRAETGVVPTLRYVPEGARQDLEVTLGPDAAAAP